MFSTCPSNPRMFFQCLIPSSCYNDSNKKQNRWMKRKPSLGRYITLMICQRAWFIHFEFHFCCQYIFYRFSYLCAIVCCWFGHSWKIDNFGPAPLSWCFFWHVLVFAMGQLKNCLQTCWAASYARRLYPEGVQQISGMMQLIRSFQSHHPHDPWFLWYSIMFFFLGLCLGMTGANECRSLYLGPGAWWGRCHLLRGRGR